MMIYSWKVVAKNVIKNFSTLHKLTNRLGLLTFIVSTVTVIAVTINIPPIISMLGGGQQMVQDSIQISLTAAIIIMCLMAVKRIHDVGYTAASLLVAFIPYVGIPAVAFLLLLKGEKTANRWGEPEETFSIQDFYRNNKNDDPSW